MPVQQIEIEKLQPTDNLRVESFSYLVQLADEELDKIDEKEGHPQAWLVDGKIIISDGNQRTAARAMKGKRVVNVDYQGELPSYLAGFAEEVLIRKTRLQKNGVYSFFDLLES
ncbi:hypothetical protein HYW76_01120 [Candidatus Pacearchaeota archaeon]|nr:hypothetical protein [Candidatus Pacearchaeota archaeon]